MDSNPRPLITNQPADPCLNFFLLPICRRQGASLPSGHMSTHGVAVLTIPPHSSLGGLAPAAYRLLELVEGSTLGTLARPQTVDYERIKLSK